MVAPSSSLALSLDSRLAAKSDSPSFSTSRARLAFAPTPAASSCRAVSRARRVAPSSVNTRLSAVATSPSRRKSACVALASSSSIRWRSEASASNARPAAAASFCKPSNSLLRWCAAASALCLAATSTARAFVSEETRVCASASMLSACAIRAALLVRTRSVESATSRALAASLRAPSSSAPNFKISERSARVSVPASSRRTVIARASCSYPLVRAFACAVASSARRNSSAASAAARSRRVRSSSSEATRR
mmetsp:Transcript_6442/g.16793  ORF Transcript_6442/g.16793 Transcript_6442/m.16793 type:complete len:251 (-) Transcript_6442:138-890(-)